MPKKPLAIVMFKRHIKGESPKLRSPAALRCALVNARPAKAMALERITVRPEQRFTALPIQGAVYLFIFFFIARIGQKVVVGLGDHKIGFDRHYHSHEVEAD
jgi:hypothetical protein